MRILWWRKKPEVFFCEICNRSGVRRTGIWDNCPQGHIYVGKRVEEVEGE